MTGNSTRLSRREGEVDFYEQEEMSSAIMSLSNMPDGILSLLQMETLAAYEAASYGCTALVELGCYDGRALEVARFTGVRYVGADIDQSAIDMLSERISKEGLTGSASGLVDDVLGHELWDRALLGVHPLYVVPFNLLGNFRHPERFVQSLASVGGSAVVSVFNDGPDAGVVRRAYYSRCGVMALRSEPMADGGVLFNGEDGFYSRSYTEESFRRLLVENKTEVVAFRQNLLGFCATVALGGSPVRLPVESATREGMAR